MVILHAQFPSGQNASSESLLSLELMTFHFMAEACFSYLIQSPAVATCSRGRAMDSFHLRKKITRLSLCSPLCSGLVESGTEELVFKKSVLSITLPEQLTSPSSM